MYICSFTHVALIIITGVSQLPKRIPTEKDTINNPVYHNANDSDHFSDNPVKESIYSYAETSFPTTGVKMSTNPAYAVQ